MLRVATALLLPLLALAPPAGAQEASPEPVQVNASLLRPGVDSMHVFLVREGERRHIGMVWDEIAVTDRNGVAALRRVYRTVNQVFEPHLDTIYSRLPDLKPIAHVSFDRVSSQVEFRSDSILGWHTDLNGKRHEIRRAADEALYDANTFDLLVRSAPLHEGLRISVPAFVPGRDGVEWLHAVVTGLERVAGYGGASRDAWRIEMDFSGVPSTLWVDTSTRALLRQIIRLDDEFSVLTEQHPSSRGGVLPRASEASPVHGALGR